MWLEVTGTDTDQTAADDFLLVTTVTTGLSCAISQIGGDFGWKLHFSHICVFKYPLRGTQNSNGNPTGIL